MIISSQKLTTILAQAKMPPALQMIISLLGVLGLFFMLFFALRMFSRRITTNGGRLRVIDRASLGRDSMLLVVAVAGKVILVGVSSQRVEQIADLEMTEDEYIESAFNSPHKNVPFSDILSTVGASFGIKKKENASISENVNEANEKNDG